MPSNLNLGAHEFAGEIVFTARATAPAGFLKCNGAAISRTTYADLFAAIGTTYGAGDGSTTFNVPETRGEFLRCLDDGRSVDTGRTRGSAQKGTLAAGEMDGSSNQVTGLFANTGSFASQFYADQPSAADCTGRSFVQTGGTLAGEVVYAAATYTAYMGMARPRNIAFLTCIRY